MMKHPLLLLTLLRHLRYNRQMESVRKADPRPDVEAALRGRDASSGMDGEVDPTDASKEEAVFWTKIYSDIWEMEEKVLTRVQELMATQSETVRREVRLTNVPVIEAQAARFRDRLGYWEARLVEIRQIASIEGDS